MNSTCEISCIIPFYNEGERLLSVLDMVTQVHELTQIICVDDGSADDMLQTIQGQYPQIVVVRLPENKGKTAAIKRGLDEVKSEYVLLMDADLQNVRSSELNRMVSIVKAGCEADMLILRRLHAEWFVKISRGDVLLSGERIIRKKDLEAILNEPVQGFQLELATNDYMLRNGRVVRWVPWSAKNTYKMDKRGPLSGFFKDAKMYVSIVNYVGVRSFVNQVRTFARRPLPNQQRQRWRAQL